MPSLPLLTQIRDCYGLWPNSDAVVISKNAEAAVSRRERPHRIRMYVVKTSLISGDLANGALVCQRIFILWHRRQKRDHWRTSRVMVSYSRRLVTSFSQVATPGWGGCVTHEMWGRAEPLAPPALNHLAMRRKQSHSIAACYS